MGDKEDDQSPHRHFVPVVDSCCSVALNVLQRLASLATDPAQHRHFFPVVVSWFKSRNDLLICNSNSREKRD